MPLFWYNSLWVDAFNRTLRDGSLWACESVYRPTEQEAFHNLALQSEYAMRLRTATEPEELKELKELKEAEPKLKELKEPEGGTQDAK